jgi:hypothetical protein
MEERRSIFENINRNTLLKITKNLVDDGGNYHKHILRGDNKRKDIKMVRKPLEHS